MADTDLWPQIEQALSTPGVVHPTPEHGRITVDFGIQDGRVTLAALRAVGKRGRPMAQVKPSIVISTWETDDPDDALRWFLPELIQKARGILASQHEG